MALVEHGAADHLGNGRFSPVAVPPHCLVVGRRRVLVSTALPPGRTAPWPPVQEPHQGLAYGTLAPRSSRPQAATVRAAWESTATTMSMRHRAYWQPRLYHLSARYRTRAKLSPTLSRMR